MNKRKLKSIMALYGDTNCTLAQYLGVSKQTISNKMSENYGAQFTQPEMAKIIQKYNLSPNEIVEIFFEQKVS